MSDSGGSNALKGFVYQFLHTLMELMDGCVNTRVRPGTHLEFGGQHTDSPADAQW